MRDYLFNHVGSVGYHLETGLDLLPYKYKAVKVKYGLTFSYK
jgi:hypothetical protein